MSIRPVPCVVSVAEHTGWAHLVCVAAQGNVPVVVERRRVALIEPGLPTMPYEHDTTAMREDEANAVIARVRRSIAARTSEVLRRVVAELAPAHTAVALAIREPPFYELPLTVAAVRSSYRLLCAADRKRRGRRSTSAWHLTWSTSSSAVAAARPARRGRRSIGERTPPASRCWRRGRAAESGFRVSDGRNGPHRNGVADIDQPLSARSGSVRVARQAGTKQATKDATATT